MKKFSFQWKQSCWQSITWLESLHCLSSSPQTVIHLASLTGSEWSRLDSLSNASFVGKYSAFTTPFLKIMRWMIMTHSLLRKCDLIQGLCILKSYLKFFKFVIRVNLLYSKPSLFLYGLSLSLSYFSILVDYYFRVFFSLRQFYSSKITQTEYYDCAPSIEPKYTKAFSKVKHNLKC